MENHIVKYLGENINSPAHDGDVGHDLVAASEPRLIGEMLDEDFYSLLEYIEYEIRVAVAPPSGVFSLVYPRSSISSNTNLVLANSVGVIDNGYRNTIKVRFRYIPQPRDFRYVNGRIYVKVDRKRIYQKGDRVAQLVFAEMLPTTLEPAVLDETARGKGGFGSTGK